MVKLQPTIGLEIHVELKTKSKMFCNCPNDPNEQRPNINICPICTGQPGVLPVANEEAIERVIKTGLSLNCQISECSKFDRKNYFYPDLPKGYQISQLYEPFCLKGFLKIDRKKIRIREVHLEEDTGRLIHNEKEDSSLVDFNRSGVPLMELVTEPDIKSAEEARKFAEELQLILRYLNVSDADMEKGQMRIEVNISLGIGKKMGTKVEIKNLNSFRAVEKGIEYEIRRQKETLEAGGKVIQETRGWQEGKGITVSQRTKEEAHDYKYFPEPDLPPFHFNEKIIQGIKVKIPELPQQKRERFKKEYKLANKEIEIFTQNKDLGEYFEKVNSELKDWINSVKRERKIPVDEQKRLAQLCVNYLLTDLQFLLKGTPFSEEKLSITPENFAELIAMIHIGKISSKIGKTILPEMFKTGGDPSQILKEKGLTQITDGAEIEKKAKEVIIKNQKAVEDYKKGKETSLQFLIGQLMKETKGTVHPQKAAEILKEILKH